MANTFVKIATVTVGSGGSSTLDFTSIPSTYTDLQLLISARSSDAVFLRGMLYKLNSNSSSIYSYRELYGFNTTAGSFSETNISNGFMGQMPGTSGTSNTFGSSLLYIPNYTGNTNKSLSIDNVTEINSALNWQNDLIAGLWANTSAITGIQIYPVSGNFAQYTTATLYGIKNS